MERRRNKRALPPATSGVGASQAIAISLAAIAIAAPSAAQSQAAPSAQAPAAAPAPDTKQPAPAATPAPTATPAAQPAPVAQACLPACREGFLCIQGGCVSACNPACPQGEECTSDGRCVLPAEEPPAELEEETDEADDARASRKSRREQQRLSRRERAKRLRAERLEHRQRPRIVVGMRMGIQDVEPNGVLTENVTVGQLAFQAGYRQNFVDHFGLLAVFDASLGGWNEFDDEQGDVRALRMQLSPYFGPMGRFTFGPTLALGRTWYQHEDDDGNSIGDAEGVWLGGYGLQGGLLLGSREAFQMHFQLLCFGEKRGGPDFFTGDSIEGSMSFGYAF